MAAALDDAMRITAGLPVQIRFFSHGSPFERRDSAQGYESVKALNPDVCIMHGLAADPAGNTLFVPPYGEDVFGAFASKNGVIITVEKIVSTEFIRRHSHLIRIPGYVVKSVSEVPFGSHPWGVGNIQVPELPAYADDSEFQYELREVFEDPKETEAWIEKWILSCPSHDDYAKTPTKGPGFNLAPHRGAFSCLNESLHKLFGPKVLRDY